MTFIPFILLQRPSGRTMSLAMSPENTIPLLLTPARTAAMLGATEREREIWQSCRQGPPMCRLARLNDIDDLLENVRAWARAGRLVYGGGNPCAASNDAARLSPLNEAEAPMNNSMTDRRRRTDIVDAESTRPRMIDGNRDKLKPTQCRAADAHLGASSATPSTRFVISTGAASINLIRQSALGVPFAAKEEWPKSVTINCAKDAMDDKKGHSKKMPFEIHVKTMPERGDVARSAVDWRRAFDPRAPPH
jgi:hypothetical protein